MKEYKIDTGLVEKATELIYLGLRQQKNLTAEPYHMELLKMYRNESMFRELVHVIARGLKLGIIEIDESGVFLRPDHDSIFAKKRSDLLNLTKGGRDKYSFVILIGLAAQYFPKESSFDERSQYITEPITISELDEYIRKRCRMLKERENPEDSIAGDKTTELLLNSYLSLPSEEKILSSSRNTSNAHIRNVFTFLKSEKLLLEEDGKFYPTMKFKNQIYNLTENEGIRRLIELFQGES
ncbi:MAG: hypothetical protein EAX96_06100 [Candidatus Lokiarchaeota archaeon]|nr:hypothetical protein [Candidatus Lokiarchaeota archaeon]